MAERVLPQTRNELLDNIQQEWSALMAVIERLTPAQMIAPDTGGWSPRDNLAHLTEWMKILLGYYMDQRPSHEVIGVSSEVTENWDFDVINQVFFERNRHRPVNDVVDELKLVYAEVVARLESTPFEDLLKPRFDDDPDKQPILSWVVGDTSEHFAEHRLIIEGS